MTEMKPPKIGVVLGAGAARGWAHIGVLQGLEAIGLKPDVVAGCSSGALVGAAYVSGGLDDLDKFARSLTWSGMLRFFDISWRGGGLIQGRWLVDVLNAHFTDEPIEALAARSGARFGAVATELPSGRETWLTEGAMVDAVRASIALPGLITPARLGGRWLVDGALVNPLPVSLCRALGAEVIIGVSLQGDLVTRRPVAFSHAPPPTVTAPEGVDLGDVELKDMTLDDVAAAAGGKPTARSVSWLQWMVGQGWSDHKTSAPEDRVFQGGDLERVADSDVDAASAPDASSTLAATAPPRPAVGGPVPKPLGYLDVLGDTLFIVQNFVSRVRLAADPVEVLIAPDVSSIGVMDFHRGAEAIDEGRRAVDAAAETLQALAQPGVAVRSASTLAV